MQFSSEEEMDEVPLHEMEDSKGAISISVEMPMEAGADDDSQQAAEAMVQLGNMSYYQQHEGEAAEQLMFKGTNITEKRTTIYCYTFVLEESLDVDPNYDPSDFLMAGLPMATKHEDLTVMDVTVEDSDVGIKIHDDLAVSESEDEGSMGQHPQIQEEDDAGDLWF